MIPYPPGIPNPAARRGRGGVNCAIAARLRRAGRAPQFAMIGKLLRGRRRQESATSEPRTPRQESEEDAALAQVAFQMLRELRATTLGLVAHASSAVCGLENLVTSALVAALVSGYRGQLPSECLVFGPQGLRIGNSMGACLRMIRQAASCVFALFERDGRRPRVHRS